MIQVSTSAIVYPRNMPSWAVGFDWKAIGVQAQNFGLDACLIAAVIQQESGGNRSKMRFEKAWKDFLDPARFAKLLGITGDTETMLQMFSYGPMQIMGATAREFGFRGHLVELASDSIGLYYGCAYLSHQMKHFGKVPEALAAYNAGPGSLADGMIHNMEYVNSVGQYYFVLTGEHF